MTTHLSPEEFVDALERALPAARSAHLVECDACRLELESLRETLRDTAAVPAAEPSPLFWDHFSARVAAATSGAPARRWWQPMWKPLTVAAAAAVVTLAVWTRDAASPAPTTPVETVVANTELTMFEDDGSWEFVVGLTSEMAYDDVRAAVTPAAGTADAAIADLTPEQAAELMRLLRQEIGEP